MLLSIRIFVCLTVSIAVSITVAGAQAVEWPVEPSSGLLWYWRDLQQPGMIEDAEGNWVRDCDVRLRRRTRPNWFLGADVNQGSLHAPDMGDVIARAINDTKPLFVEMALHPHGPASRSGVVMYVGPIDGPGLLELVLDDGRLQVLRHGGDLLDLGALPLQAPTHLAVSINHAQVEWWLDGVAQDTKAWTFSLLPIDEDVDLELSFGGRLSAGGEWRGVLETILLAETRRDPVLSAAAWRKRHAQRSAPASTTVEAVLVAHAEEPDPSDLMDYDECILAGVWRIERHLEGPPINSEMILSWHWYQLDRRVLDDARPPALGSRRTLRLGASNDHSEIASIQRVDAGLDPMHLLELTEYLILNEQIAEE